jgi:hypothetical protein
MSIELSSLPSNRKFGFQFSGIGALVTAYLWWSAFSFQTLALVAAASVAIAMTAAVRPGWLEPLKRGWFRLGHVLGMVVSPIVLGVVFFLLLTPLAVALRIAGRDTLRLRRCAAATYWIDRPDPMPTAESFRNQF